MTITRKIRINEIGIEITNLTNTPGLLLTPELLAEIRRQPDLLEAIDSLLPHIAPALEFEDFFSVIDEDFFSVIDKYFNPAELGELLENPVLGGQAKEAIAAYLDKKNMRDWINKTLGINPKINGYVYLLRADLSDLLSAAFPNPCKVVLIPGRTGFGGKTKLPFPAKRLHEFPANNVPRIRAYLFDHYAAKRGKDDWFNLAEADIAEICKITKYQNPIVEKMGGPAYLIQADLSDLLSGALSPHTCKIGWAKTKNLQIRMNEFHKTFPFEFERIHIIPAAGARAAEKMLQDKRYPHRRTRGEWFNLSPDDIAAIKAITSYENHTLITED